MSGEDALIAKYFKPLATHPAARNLIDDAAVLATTGDDLVITADAIVEGVHFLKGDPPDTIARKALRVNLSDIAAKGASPTGFVLTLALREVREDFLAPFSKAIGEDIAAFNCPLLGGDTVSTPGPLMISVTAFGHLSKGKAVSREGARAGDIVFVSGSIGDAALGLDVLQGRLSLGPKHQTFLIDRYRVPQPRLSLAAAVCEHATAAMDVSDGLVGDLAKLCAASRMSARMMVEHVPLSDAARAALMDRATDWARILSGGDDYEILCTVPENRAESFTAAAEAAKVPVSRIGIVTEGGQVPAFIGADGQAMSFKSASYSHF